MACIQMSNLPSLPNTNIRRHTACVMLFVWLFALASGVANACLLEPRADHAHADAHASQRSQLAPADGAIGVGGHHTESVARLDDDSHSMPSKESCLKACDAGSQSVLKHAASFDQVDPGLAHFVATAWTAQARIAPTTGRAADFRLPERGPPIRVLLSRLAL